MFKNSIEQKESQKGKLMESFAPQNDEYYSSINKSAIFIYIFAAYFFLMMIVFIVFRLLYGYCKGPKVMTPSYGRKGIFLLSFGILMFTVSSGFALKYSYEVKFVSNQK